MLPCGGAGGSGPEVGLPPTPRIIRERTAPSLLWTPWGRCAKPFGAWLSPGRSGGRWGPCRPECPGSVACCPMNLTQRVAERELDDALVANLQRFLPALPHGSTVENVAAIVAAVSPKPVNLAINSPLMTVAPGSGSWSPPDQRGGHPRAHRMGGDSSRPPGDLGHRHILPILPNEARTMGAPPQDRRTGMAPGGSPRRQLHGCLDVGTLAGSATDPPAGSARWTYPSQSALHGVLTPGLRYVDLAPE